MARVPEWKSYGDPRCSDGRFVPKTTLQSLLENRRIDTTLFARDLGINRSSLSRMLNGKQYMGNQTVICAAAILHVDVRVLLEWGDRTAEDVRAIRKDLAWNMEHDRDGTLVNPNKYGIPAYSHEYYDPECGIVTSWDPCVMPGDFRDPDRLVRDLVEFADKTYRSRPDDLLDVLAPTTTTLSERYPGLVRAKQQPEKGRECGGIAK